MLTKQKIWLLVIYLHFSKKYSSGWWYTYPAEKYEFVSWDLSMEYLPTFAQHKSPSHVGKYTIHGVYGNHF